MKKRGSLALVQGLLIAMNAFSQVSNSDQLLEKLLGSDPAFADVLKHRNEWNVQIIYSEIERKGKNKIKISDHYFNVDDQRYYYPASTVKLPIVLLALQKLNELNIPGLDMNSTMITGSAAATQTEVYNDPSSKDGRPSIAHYIKKILLVSDNDAFNRLYEFLGQEYINNSLHRLGYSNAEIVHRLDVSLTEQENRTTNPVSFYDSTGKLLFSKSADTSTHVYARTERKLGKGYMKGGQLIENPMDFSAKNCLPLTALHKMIRNVILPASLPNTERFDLRESDLAFIRTYMSMPATSSDHPDYNTPEYWDTYVKFLFYGSEPGAMLPWLKIYNKVGDAYGFLIDGAYIQDTKNQVDLFLSAVIYCNSDGILNDDHYDYDSIGLPFMKALGRKIHERELKKKNP